MKIGLTDTPADIQYKLIEGYRSMSPWRKMQLVDELTLSVQQLALARIRQQYPDETEREHRLRLGSLWLGRETMIQVYHWDPQAKGY